MTKKYGRPSKRRGRQHERPGEGSWNADRIPGNRPRPGRTEPRGLDIDPAGPLPAVYLSSLAVHPLVYRKRLRRVDGARPGDLVAVYDANDGLAGYGLFNPSSEIVVRVLWRDTDVPTIARWRDALQRAVALRRQLLQLDQVTNAYRVVHAEADQLSGIVIDRFNDVLSAEVFSLGMYQRARSILAELHPLCGTQHSIVRTSPHFASQEGCDPLEVASPDLPSLVTIAEHGTRFRIRFADAHKTGFFCDQRDNRLRLAGFCAGKSVLDVCCYSGGFAVQAKCLGKADEVTGVDLDHVPLALARENAHLNQARIRFVQADAFAYMREMAEQGRQYDVVVLDPPKLIRTRAELEAGTRKHFALNGLAMRLVRPGGLLLSCSCAGLLSETEFVRLLVAAARRTPRDDPSATQPLGRDLQIIARTGAAPDHPVIGNCLETEYLKAVWMVIQ